MSLTKETSQPQHAEHAADRPTDEGFIEDTAPGLFLSLCVVATAIGGMLFGYDTGVISGVLVVIGSDLNGRPLEHWEKELITGLCAGGALIGAIIAGVTADKYGRKPAIWFASVLFTIGALIQAASYSIIQMSVGRILVGLVVGSASMIMPLYIAEISPAKYRGRMISIDMVFLETGSLLAYAFNAAFANVAHGWRYMSPRQLLFHDQMDKCVAVLRRMYPKADNTQIDRMVASIQQGVAEAKALNEEISSTKALKSVCTIPSNRRAAIVACGLMATQQLCGFNTLMHYSSTLFQIVGFNDPVAVGTVVAGTNWLMTFLSIFLIDRVGRRRLLLWTMWGMPVFLAIAAVVFHWIPLDQNTLELTSDEVGWPAIVVLVSMILFVAFYAAGLGCVPWQANEFLPMEVRAMGTTLMNVCVWGPNIIVSSTFLSMMRGISPSGTFGFYAGLSFIGLVFVYFCYPEAAGLTLEEIRTIFEDGFGVRFAAELQKQRKAGTLEHRMEGGLEAKIKTESDEAV
ncbi:MFS domain-containing protein [Fusarium sp. LHS14.1]|nr:MFS domain-containing protein [Fusarium sp. LHS14.1]